MTPTPETLRAALDELRRLEQAATPGPWYWDKTMGGIRVRDRYIKVTPGMNEYAIWPDAAFIVAAVEYVRAALQGDADAPDPRDAVIERLTQVLRVANHKPHDQDGEPIEGFPVCSVCGAIQTGDADANDIIAEDMGEAFCFVMAHTHLSTEPVCDEGLRIGDAAVKAHTARHEAAASEADR